MVSRKGNRDEQTARARAGESGHVVSDAGWPGKPSPSNDREAFSEPGISSDDELLERIRARAYQLWQAAGSPEGRADDYWYEAETQIRAGVGLRKIM